MKFWLFCEQRNRQGFGLSDRGKMGGKLAFMHEALPERRKNTKNKEKNEQKVGKFPGCTHCKIEPSFRDQFIAKSECVSFIPSSI